MTWISEHKDEVAVAISLIALGLSAATFYRNLRRDRRERRDSESQKLPIVSLSAPFARRQKIYLPGTHESVPGWDFEIRLALENRFGVPAVLARLAAVDPSGALVRLHSPISSDFLGHDPDPTDLKVDRSGVYFKPIAPQTTREFRFHAHVASDAGSDTVEAGYALTLTFDFELQEDALVRRSIVRSYIVHPGRVVSE